MLVYLSGKMSGLPYDNHPEFHRATARLRALGYHVINPAETAGGESGISRKRLLSIDSGYVQAVDAVVCMAPDCFDSKGAKYEMILASCLDIPVYLFDWDEGLGQQISIDDWVVKISEVEKVC